MLVVITRTKLPGGGCGGWGYGVSSNGHENQVNIARSRSSERENSLGEKEMF